MFLLEKMGVALYLGLYSIQKCNCSVACIPSFLPWTYYKASKHIMDFTPDSWQYAWRPWLLKEYTSTAVDVLDVI
jgi:hypothetical protein